MADSQTQPTVLVHETAAEAMAEAAKLFKTLACEAIGERDVCRVALAGGTTPHALYQSLAEEGVREQMPWGKLEFFFGDERDVPLDHVESNYNMVQRIMLDHLPISPSRVHPMRADADDLPAAAAEYERIIRAVFDVSPEEVPRFDLILLGLGADGHTASLFPGCEPVDVEDRLVTACFVPVLGRWRMTFTFPLINAARNVVLLVTGRDKAHVVASLLSQDPARKEGLPVARVCPSDGRFLIVLDEAANRLSEHRPT